MKVQVKRVLAILFAVLFVTTLTVSAVSAGSVSTMQASSFIAHDGYCGNGYYPLYYILHHIPIPPQPDPWFIDQNNILSKGQTSV